VLDAIWDNLFIGYDLVILLFAVANFIFLFITIKQMLKLKNILYPRIDSASTKKNETHISIKVSTKEDLEKLKKVRDNAVRWYSLFTNFIAIFPLLGLLGTVIALLGVAGGDDYGNVEHNFFVALTSTLWGVGCAIVFKVVNALIAPSMEKYDVEAERKKIRYEDEA